jgi:hypothetical protein
MQTIFESVIVVAIKEGTNVEELAVLRFGCRAQMISVRFAAFTGGCSNVAKR